MRNLHNFAMNTLQAQVMQSVTSAIQIAAITTPEAMLTDLPFLPVPCIRPEQRRGPV